MPDKFGRLALHMWTIDTTPLATALDAAKLGGFDAVELRRTDFKRCFDAGMSNAQVLDIIKKSGIPCGVLGVEYGWLFATGEESKRLFKVFRESLRERGRARLRHVDERTGPGAGPDQGRHQISARGRRHRRRIQVEARHRIQFAARRAQQPGRADRTDRGRQQAELRLSDRRLSLHAQRRRRPRLRERAGRQDLLLPVQRPLAQPGDRRAAADRPAAARQGRRQMARDARPAGGKRLHRVSELRGAQPRTMGALALRRRARGRRTHSEAIAGRRPELRAS